MRQVAMDISRRRSGGAKPYKARLEYLEVLTGGPYINTGKVFHGNYTIQGKYLKTNGNAVCGFSASDCMTNYNEFRRFNIQISKYGPYGVEHTFSWGRDVYLDGEYIGSYPVDNPLEPTGSPPLYVFARLPANDLLTGRIYYIQMLDGNNQLVFDYIPVIDMNDSPCMFDRVSESFFYNAGTGSFTAGPVAGGGV